MSPDMGSLVFTPSVGRYDYHLSLHYLTFINLLTLMYQCNDTTSLLIILKHYISIASTQLSCTTPNSTTQHHLQPHEQTHNHLLIIQLNVSPYSFSITYHHVTYAAHHPPRTTHHVPRITHHPSRITTIYHFSTTIIHPLSSPTRHSGPCYPSHHQSCISFRNTQQSHAARNNHTQHATLTPIYQY